MLEEEKQKKGIGERRGEKGVGERGEGNKGGE